MKRTIKITNERRYVLSWLLGHPGANTAEIDRARRTARGGHKWMYALIDRALEAGLVERCPSRSGRGGGMRCTALAERLLTQPEAE